MRGELETKQRLQHIDPQFFRLLQHFFPILLGCSTGGSEGPASAGTWFSLLELQQLTPNPDLQLTRSSCSTGLYNCLTPTCFSKRRICTQFNPSTVNVIPWYLRPDAPVIYTGTFLIWQLGQVGGQYVTEQIVKRPPREDSKIMLTRNKWRLKNNYFIKEL